MTPKHQCEFPGCANGADPRWGGYCDGHGATTEREVENRHSAIVAIATEAVDLRAQVAALREQRRVLRESLAVARKTMQNDWYNKPRIGMEAEAATVDAALEATKEEP